MTADDAPRTLLAAVERELRSVAFGAAIERVLKFTEANSFERKLGIDIANTLLDEDRTNLYEEARDLVKYLNANFDAGLDELATRKRDDRPASMVEPIEAAETARREKGIR